MDLIHADATLREIGVVTGIQEADIELFIGADAHVVENSFSLSIDDLSWQRDPINIGHAVYIPGTEWGGIVTQVDHVTETGTVTVLGPTWRGLLYQKIIVPPAGQAYKIVTDMDASSVLDIVVGSSFGDMFVVDPTPIGVSITAKWRYDSIAAGLHKSFRIAGLKLNVIYDNIRGAVVLSVSKIVDYSDAIDLSQDYGVDFVSSNGLLDQYNHCIALGQGELVDRIVLNVYRVGSKYYTIKPKEWDVAAERTTVLDYPNAETRDELLSFAISKLEESMPTQSIAIDQIAVGVNVDLGDIVGARDRLTGMAASSTIVRKILTVRNGEVKLEAKVE